MDRDYRSLCLSMGACPACIDAPPEPYGCPDCLNTGWITGDPYEQIDVLEQKLELYRTALNAGIKLKGYLEKSINAGPLTTRPDREAALMLDFYRKIDAAREHSPTPTSDNSGGGV